MFGLASGHVDVADWLFLIAAVLFGVFALVRVLSNDVRGALVPAGLCLVAVAWLVL